MPPPTLQAQQHLPYRFRERAFRTYESAIAAVTKAYPGVITFNPKLNYNQTTETFSCRFRDAMRSFAEHAWHSTTIDHARFLTICDSISVSTFYTGGLIRIGDKDELKRPALDVLNMPSRINLPIDSDVILKLNLCESANELDLICRLAALRLLSNELKCTGFTEQDKTYYENKYDVSIAIDAGTGIASVL